MSDVTRDLGAVMETGEWLLRPSHEARPGARPAA